MARGWVGVRVTSCSFLLRFFNNRCKNIGEIIFRSQLVCLWTIGYSFLYNFVRLWFQDLFYFNICTNIVPSSGQFQGPTSSNHFEILVTLFLHISINLRAKIYKSRGPQEKNQVSDVTCVTTNFAIRRIEQVKLADFATNFLLALWLGSFSFLQLKINSLSLVEVNIYPYSHYVLGYLFYGSGLTGCFIFCIYFGRHSHFRRRIVKEIASNVRQ